MMDFLQIDAEASSVMSHVKKYWFIYVVTEPCRADSVTTMKHAWARTVLNRSRFVSVVEAKPDMYTGGRGDKQMFDGQLR